MTNPPGTPQVLLTPAATPADTTPPPTLTIDGSVTVDIASQRYTLTGSFTGDLIVEYHKDFADSISLGPVKDIAPQIATAFNFPDLATEITDTLHSLGDLPEIGGVIKVFLTASARITDLEINTQTSTYGVGLALDFTTSSPKPSLFGITLISLGFKVTKTNPAPPTASTNPATPPVS